jgi:hypothetical protein
MVNGGGAVEPLDAMERLRLRPPATWVLVVASIAYLPAASGAQLGLARRALVLLTEVSAFCVETHFAYEICARGVSNQHFPLPFSRESRHKCEQKDPFVWQRQI